MTAPQVPPVVEVDGAGVLDRLRETLTRYVVLPSGSAADAVTLWVAASHGIAYWQHATRLVIKSPEKRCGKSRLLDVVEGTCARPLMTVNATVAAIFRSIGDDDQPTLLVDEADAIFGTKMKAEQNEELRGLLNAGFGRGRPTLRTVGPQHVVMPFPTFCMVALAGIGGLPDTIEDRAVIVTMRRRTSNESVSQFRQRTDLPLLHEIRDELADWVATIGDTLADAEPDTPLEDRAADVWEPLIAIADAAGGRWPAAARSAALAMTAANEDAEAESLGPRLLADIKDLYTRQFTTFLTSANLVQQLRQLDEAPWRDIDLTTRRLADKLRAYGIKPGHNPAGTERGYQLAKFADAFARYVGSGPSDDVRPSEGPETKGILLTDQNPLTDRSVRRSQSVRTEPSNDGASNGLTATDVRTPGNPTCQSCGRANLFAPASIARGICAACLQESIAS